MTTQCCAKIQCPPKQVTAKENQNKITNTGNRKLKKGKTHGKTQQVKWHLWKEKQFKFQMWEVFNTIQNGKQ